MTQPGPAGSRLDWGTRLTRRPPLGEYAHATSAILGPSAGRDGLPAAPRGVVSGGGAHPRRHGARGQQPSVARPAGLLQILPLRPPMWSLIRRRPDEAAPTSEDGRYAVCPSCCERSPVVDSAPTLRCRRCGAVFAIAWSDSPWRAFEVLPGRPQPGRLARARAVALRALATAFGLRA